MINHIEKNYAHEYSIIRETDLVHVYESKKDECLEIDLSFAIAKNEMLNFTPVIMGSGSYKITLTFILEENAQAFVQGAYALAHDQRCLLVTRQYHLGRNSTSNLAINGIAKDHSVTDYRGMIRIEKDAAGTHAHQENKTILFSPSARATSVPSIEVLNHDVSCAHGSAVGPLDAEHLLYARARGLAEADARKMIVRSIFMEMLAKIPDSYEKESLIQRLLTQIIN